VSIDVTVIMPVFLGGDLVVGALRALDAQTLDPARYEVIVVDDGSSDGTPERCETLAEHMRCAVTVVRQPVNGGPAAARNAGIARARGRFLAFTDHDCEVAPDWLEKALARFEADPTLAGVEGRTEPKGDPGTLTHQMVNRTGGLYMTCNMIYAREAVQAIGGFDERFRLAFLEDSDVAFGVMENGGEIVFDPDVLVHHLVLQEGRAKFGREARKRMYNPLLFRKHKALYVKHLQPVVPGLPRLHVRYLGWLGLAVLFAAFGLLGGTVLALFPWFIQARRVAHAYRARDLVSVLQALAHPFVQTYWVLRGCVRFRTFSWEI
jgi:glycosyltransferase involved in cell wall biosynthesis